MSKARVTAKGQVTVPVEVRRALGIQRGDVLAFEPAADGVLVRKVTSAHALRGSIPAAGKRIPWKTARRRAWQTRAERIVRSSATRT